MTSVLIPINHLMYNSTMTTERLCQWCDKKLIRNSKYSIKQWESVRFCSNKCSTQWKMSTGKLKLFTKGHSHSDKTKSILSTKKLGDKNPNWKGGVTRADRFYIKEMVGHKKYKLQHRLIVEKHLGRELKRTEHVHHINGDKTDNRIENLIVLTKSFHHKLHHAHNRKNKK